MLLARQCLDLGSERGAGQRASGEDRGARGNVRRLFAPNGNIGVLAQRGRDVFGEVFAADGQRAARGQRMAKGGLDDQAAHAEHFVLEDAQGAVGHGAAHGVAANQFGQPVSDVGVGRPDGAHFVELDGHAAVGELPGRFTARQAAANNGYVLDGHALCSFNQPPVCCADGKCMILANQEVAVKTVPQNFLCVIVSADRKPDD